MSISTELSIQKKFTEALDNLIAQEKEDRSILAAILCGHAEPRPAVSQQGEWTG
jgi:hypothetical protein